MTKMFSFLGGRRLVAMVLTTATTFVANHLYDPETAKTVTDTILYIAGTFILGESAADAAGRFKSS